MGGRKRRGVGALKSVLLAAFFLSGFSTLVYEMVWIKYLVYLFGVTYHAITTVVCVFMLGMALGALSLGRVVDRFKSPLLLYAILELVIAACGAAFPMALSLTTFFYNRVHDNLQLSFFGHILLRFLLACFLLLVPTVAMGATLPALARFYVSRRSTIGVHLGRLYGVNTLGAALGCALTGFVFLNALGLSLTNRLAIATNLLAVIMALLVAWSPWAGTITAGPRRPEESARGSSLLLLLFLLSGFTAIGYEILWTRIVALFHPNAHTLVFSLVLLLVLLGTGLGSGLYSLRPLARLKPVTLYATVQLVVGGVALAAPRLLLWMRAAEGWSWYDGWSSARTWLDMYISWPELLFVLLVVALPALLLGTTFPLGNRMFVRRFSALGSGVGAVYFFSTLGGILGSFVCGFVLMPWLGAKGSLFLLGAVNLGLGIVLLATLASRRPMYRAIIVLAGVSASSALAVTLSGTVPNWVWLNIPARFTVDFYKDGRSTSDGVIWVGRAQGWTRYLFANGEFVAAGGLGVWMPMLFMDDPARILILSFDTGCTADMALSDPRVEQVEAADISDVQSQIAGHFATENHGVMSNPRLRVVANDGRNHLLTSRTDYDIVFNGVAAYSGYLELSTREFFRIARQRLSPGGIYMQKLHPHMLTVEGFKRVIATFVEVFPNSAMFSSRAGSLLFLAGWNGDYRQNFMELEERIRNVEGGNLLGAVGKEAAGNSRLGPRRGAPGASRDGLCWISGVEGVLECVEAQDVQQGPAQQRMAHRSGTELSRRLPGQTANEVAARFLMDGRVLSRLSRGAEIIVDDKPPRLGRTLTLIDTGSDTIASSGRNPPHPDEGRIMDLVMMNLQEPRAMFKGLSPERELQVRSQRLKFLATAGYPVKGAAPGY